MTDLFGFLILLATSASLVAYLVCALAAIRLRTGRRPAMSAFALAALFSAWAIYGAGREAILWGAMLLASGVPLYLLTRGSTRAAAADPAPPVE